MLTLWIGWDRYRICNFLKSTVKYIKITICIWYGCPCGIHKRLDWDSEISGEKISHEHMNNTKCIVQSVKIINTMWDGFISQLFSTWGKLRSMPEYSQFSLSSHCVVDSPYSERVMFVINLGSGMKRQTSLMNNNLVGRQLTDKVIWP